MIGASVLTRRFAAVCAAVGIILLAGGCGEEDGRSRKGRRRRRGEDDPSLTGKELSSVSGVSIRAVEPASKSSHTVPGEDSDFEGKNIPLRRALRMMCPESTHVCDVGPLPKGRFDVTVSGRGSGREAGWRKLVEACERAFAVRIRREQRQVDVYLLRRAPGADLEIQRAGTGDEKTDKSLSSSPYRLEFTGYSMDEVARVLEWDLRVPVLNESGLAGAYTFKTERELGEPESAAAGLRDVGLDLVPARRRVEVLIVESVGARKAP